jgi:hypothetical protein
MQAVPRMIVQAAIAVQVVTEAKFIAATTRRTVVGRRPPGAVVKDLELESISPVRILIRASR